MLKIILSKKGASFKSGGENAVTGEGVTISCPDHLVLSDLPVAKSIGRVPSATCVKHVGFVVPCKAGEKCHFCVCCDHPIAIYGRLSPCEHSFCLDCARSDSSCYICKANIQKIRAIKKGNGIFICALSGCRKSFLEKSSLDAHIKETHGISKTMHANCGVNGDLLCLQPINGTLPRSLAQPNSPSSFPQNQHLPSVTHAHNNSPHGFTDPNRSTHDHRGIPSEIIPLEHYTHPHQPHKQVIPCSAVAPRPSCHRFKPHGTRLFYPSSFTMAQPCPGSVNVSPLGPAGQAGLSASANHLRSQKAQPSRVHVRSSYINQKSADAFGVNDRARLVSQEGHHRQNLRILLSKRARE